MLFEAIRVNRFSEITWAPAAFRHHLGQPFAEIMFFPREIRTRGIMRSPSDFKKTIDPGCFSKPSGSIVFLKSLGPRRLFETILVNRLLKNMRFPQAIRTKGIARSPSDFKKTVDPGCFSKPSGSTVFLKSLGPWRLFKAIQGICGEPN